MGTPSHRPASPLSPANGGFARRLPRLPQAAPVLHGDVRSPGSARAQRVPPLRRVSADGSSNRHASTSGCAASDVAWRTTFRRPRSSRAASSKPRYRRGNPRRTGTGEPTYWLQAWFNSPPRPAVTHGRPCRQDASIGGSDDVLDVSDSTPPIGTGHGRQTQIFGGELRARRQ